MADAQEIGQRFIDAFNAHDEGRIRELNSDNAVFEAPGDVKVQGREPSTQYAMAWLNAFPDAKITVHNEFAAGDWVVQEFTFSGTHEGTLMSPAGACADGSFCQRPNSFPFGSRQVANQPMFGTGIGSSASPPSSFTFAAPALTSSTSK
jgi:predicted ester cyclase